MAYIRWGVCPKVFICALPVCGRFLEVILWVGLAPYGISYGRFLVEIKIG
jgi:hypothetical protein